MLAALFAAVLALVIGSSQAYASNFPNWENWDSNATTPDTPVTASLRGVTVQVIRGGDNALWYQVHGYRNAFTRIGGTTYAAPALTQFHDTLYLFQTGQDGNLWYQTIVNPYNSPGSWTWSSAHQVSGQSVGGIRTSLRPSIASDGNNLHVVAVGNNERIYQGTLNGSTFGGFSEIPGGGRTESGASASTSPDGRLGVIHRGTDNRIYIQWQNLGTGQWEGSWRLQTGTNTNAAPCITYISVSGQLLETWRDANTGRVEIAEVSPGQAYLPWIEDAPDQVITSAGPSASPSPNGGVTVNINGGNFYDVRGNLTMINGHVYNLFDYQP
ncbi:hypothetical protein ACWDSD_33515 [Streptomyces spiralis]